MVRSSAAGETSIAGNSPHIFELWSRNQKDFTRRFPAIADAITSLPDETVIDGEIVALDGDGLPAFNRLQDFDTDKGLIVFYAFDLPIVGGLDLRRQPLETRREMLRELIAKMPDPIRFSEAFIVPPARLMPVVREKGLEGVVAKRRSSQYQAGKRSDDWVKVRANRVEEFVVGGYVPTARSFESILVGCYQHGRLMYAGAIRAGFVSGSRGLLFPELQRLQVTRCRFANLPDLKRGRCGEGITAEKMAGCRWLKPHLLVLIEFLEWTPEMRLRHPRFAGLCR